MEIEIVRFVMNGRVELNVPSDLQEKIWVKSSVAFF